MNWFTDTFLPDLLDRAGTDRPLWLTAKQTAVCVRNMERQSVRSYNYLADQMQNHDNYITDWSGRKVILSYSKLNGCGTISFTMTAQEAADARAIDQAERKQAEAERMERTRNNPERKAKRIKIAQAEIDRALAQLADAEDDNDTEIIAYLNQVIADAQKIIDYLNS